MNCGLSGSGKSGNGQVVHKITVTDGAMDPVLYSLLEFSY